jgi:predicted TPR repeat methyltransferase
MNDHDKTNERVRAALSLDGTNERIESLYARWAGDYDDDLQAERYTAPDTMTRLVMRLRDEGRILPAAGRPKLRALDAGCGTGLLGVRLRAVLDCELDGFDLSEEMVERARATGAYRRLRGRVDLNRPLAAQIDASGYDLALACGVFTLGHVPPESMRHLIDAVRPGGVVLVSARNSYCERSDFDAVCDRLVAEGRATGILREIGPYISAEDAVYRAFERPPEA